MTTSTLLSIHLRNKNDDKVGPAVGGLKVKANLRVWPKGHGWSETVCLGGESVDRYGKAAAMATAKGLLPVDLRTAVHHLLDHATTNITPRDIFKAIDGLVEKLRCD